MTHQHEKISGLFFMKRFAVLQQEKNHSLHDFYQVYIDRYDNEIKEIQKDIDSPKQKLVPATERPFFETHATDFELINQDL